MPYVATVITVAMDNQSYACCCYEVITWPVGRAWEIQRQNKVQCQYFLKIFLIFLVCWMNSKPLKEVWLKKTTKSYWKSKIVICIFMQCDLGSAQTHQIFFLTETLLQRTSLWIRNKKVPRYMGHKWDTQTDRWTDKQKRDGSTQHMSYNTKELFKGYEEYQLYEKHCYEC